MVGSSSSSSSSAAIAEDSCDAIGGSSSQSLRPQQQQHLQQQGEDDKQHLLPPSSLQSTRNSGKQKQQLKQQWRLRVPGTNNNNISSSSSSSQAVDSSSSATLGNKELTHAIPMTHSRSSPLQQRSLGYYGWGAVHVHEFGGEAQERGATSTTTVTANTASHAPTGTNGERVVEEDTIATASARLLPPPNISLTRTFSTPTEYSSTLLPNSNPYNLNYDPNFNYGVNTRNNVGGANDNPLKSRNAGTSAFGNFQASFRRSRSNTSSGSFGGGGGGYSSSGSGGGSGVGKRGGGSDPGISAFHPVWSSKSLRSMASSEEEGVGVIDSNGSEGGGKEGGSSNSSNDSMGRSASPEKKPSPSRIIGSKLFSNLKGAVKKSVNRRSNRSGRENPAPSLLGDDDEEDNIQSRGRIIEGSGHGKKLEADKKEDRKASEAKQPRQQQQQTIKGELKSSPEEQYDDPGVALSMSSDSEIDDFDDKAIDSIVGQYHPLDEERHPRPPSIELPGVEIISRMMTQTLSTSELRPSSIEVGSIEISHDGEEGNSPIHDQSPIHTQSSINEDAADSSPAYHPLVDENDEYEGHDVADVDITDNTIGSEEFRFHLKYNSPTKLRSPSRNESSPRRRSSSRGVPDVVSNNSNNSPSSHESRLSSSNSRMTVYSGGNNTIQTESSLVDADFEVREANRRSSHNHRHREEVNVDLDGNATVFSSSTSSSHFNAYVNSPRPLRDGATLPVDRFFAGGNVVLTPRSAASGGGIAATRYRGEDEDEFPSGAEMNISKFISLSPKKRRDAAHSPHTVSSASVSNTSSSGSETKKPLKFVTYELEERESPTPKAIVDCGNLSLEEHSLREESGTSVAVAAGDHGSRLIKPRISKGTDKRPPMKPSYQKTPQSPRKASDWLRGTGARTPTRTPPPREAFGGATTPRSPPVIVDGPNVLRGDLKREGTTKPNVVRRASHSGGGKMFLIPPTTGPYVKAIPAQQPVTMTSPLGDNLTVVSGDANDGSQEVFVAPINTALQESLAAMISPDRKQSATAKQATKTTTTSSGILSKKKGGQGSKGRGKKEAAVVSPDKGF